MHCNSSWHDTHKHSTALYRYDTLYTRILHPLDQKSELLKSEGDKIRMDEE